jgi:hypothetical protein
VRGEQRSLANIETIQDGSDLHIGTKGMLLNPRHRLRVELVLPICKNWWCTAAAKPRCRALAATAGAAAARLGQSDFSGRYRTLTAGIHGSGHLNLNAGSSDHVTLEMRARAC